MAETLNHGGVPANDDDDDPYGGYHRMYSYMFPKNFPEGLRVLVFDEDPEYLLILERHLQEFQYKVTICNEERKAMFLLRNHTDKFDIAMIQVNNSAGSRFRFISEIASETDLSIIIISKDDSVQSVIKWMSNGASDYLIKPIRPEDLQIIFKHMVTKRRGRRSVVAVKAKDKAVGEKSSSVGVSTIRKPNKRKRSTCPNAEANEEGHGHDDNDRRRASSRVVWNAELDKKFVDAVNCLGMKNAVPKKILEIMNVDYLTRDNIASHLQKYREELKRKKEKEERIKRVNMKLPLINQQEGIMYVEADASNSFRGRTVQFQPHHINNIPQPSYLQQHTTNPNNLMTQLRPPPQHCDGVSLLPPGGNLMTHQYHHHHRHQTTEFTAKVNFSYDMFDHEEEPPVAKNLIPTMEEYYSSFEMRINDHEATGSLPTSSYTYSSFLDQLETGGSNYNSGYPFNNNKLPNLTRYG